MSGDATKIIIIVHITKPSLSFWRPRAISKLQDYKNQLY